jgi:hypothetical protein
MKKFLTKWIKDYQYLKFLRYLLDRVEELSYKALIENDIIAHRQLDADFLLVGEEYEILKARLFGVFGVIF